MEFVFGGGTAMINTYLLSNFSKSFTKETFLFLKYFISYKEKEQNAKLLYRCKDYELLPPQAKKSLSVILRCCSARLFEMDNLCQSRLGDSFITISLNQDSQDLLALRKLVYSAVDLLSQKKLSSRIQV